MRTAHRARTTRELVQRCVRCGCTDSDCRQCIERTGSPCYWVQSGLCSACDFPILAGGTYECHDGKTRVVDRVLHKNVSYREGNSRRYTISLARFNAMAKRIVAWQAVA